MTIIANPINESHLNIPVKWNDVEGIFTKGTYRGTEKFFFCSNSSIYNGDEIDKMPKGFKYSWSFPLHEKIDYTILSQTHEIW